MSTEEIENYFVESAGYGRDKVRNFMDIVNKALKQKGERITELEKENAELRAKESFVGEQNRKLCEQQQKIEVLENENIELKEELKDADEKVVHLACNQNKDLKRKLIKAKEILQEYIRINLLPPIERNFDDEVKLFKQAEQFLSEVEK